MQYKIFHAVPAIAVQIISKTKYALLYLDDNPDGANYGDTSLRFEVDFAATPKRTAWADIQVDDRGVLANGNESPPHDTSATLQVTDIGSGTLDSPVRGNFVGAAYLESAFYAARRTKHFPTWPLPGVILPTLTSIVEKNDAGLQTRYHGFDAVITDVVNNVAKTDTIINGAKAGSIDLALNGVDYLKTPPAAALGGLPSLAQNMIKGGKGIIFVELKAGAKAKLRRPKIPIGLGG